MKKLHVDEEWIDRWEKFWTKCKLLGSHLGPVLFQFPPGFKNTPITLERFDDLAEITSKQFLNESVELFFYFNNTDSHSPPAAIQDCRFLAKAFQDLQIMSK